MTREFLKAQGLTDEQIDKVMAEHGKDITKQKEAVEAKQKEVESLSEQLSDANKQVKEFKDMKIEDIKQKAEDFETKYNKSLEDLKASKEEALLEKKLSALKAHDIDVVKSLIKRDQLVFNDDDVIGFDDQITKLQTDKAFLFIQDQGPGEIKPKFTADGKSTKGTTEITKEQFNAMSYKDRTALYNSDKAMYDLLSN